MLTKYKSLALLLILSSLATACEDLDGDEGCRPLDSDHDGLVYKCGEELPYDGGNDPPPSNPRKDAGNQSMDAGDEDDAGQD